MSATSRLCAASRAWYTTPVICTASPARRSLTTSSVRGVVILFAAISPPLSERDGLVPLRVALHVDGHRHAGDVARHLLDEHVEGRGAPAEALRADAECVDPLEQLVLHRRDARVRVRAADVAQQRPLGEQGDLLDGAADA